MAAIREVLTLEDRFSASFTKYLQMGQKAAGATTLAKNALQNYQSVMNTLDRRLIGMNSQFSVMTAEQNRLIAAGKQNSAAFSNLDAQMERLGATIRQTQAQYNAVEKEAREAASATNQFSQSNKNAAQSSGSLLTRLRGLLGAYVGFQSITGLANLSDQIVSIRARLDMMNDGLQTTEELNQMIYQSAMRSRGAYTDTAAFVAKLGTLAGNAFSSNQEIIAFAEQINKQMAISGTTTTEANAAMLQLTQGLSSGVLRGEELNSVLEQTPMIAQTIANYMGVNTGQMRELASEGKVTAEVVKNAMLSAAEETNAAFAQMPMTWGQVWTQFKNVAVQALQPVLDAVNWLANNTGTVIPIIAGMAGAMLAFSAATAIATGSATGLLGVLTAISAHPIVAVISAGIGIIIALISKWVQSVGGLEVAWLILKDTVLTVFENLKYGAMVVATGIFDAFGSALANLAMVFQSFGNGAITVLNVIISGLNKLGAGINKIDYLTFGDKAMESYQKAYNERHANLSNLKVQNQMEQAARAGEIIRKQNQVASGATTSAGGNTTPTYDQVAGISDSVKGIEKSVNMSEEDIKSLVDVAERRYVNQVNLTSQTPVITVNGANTGNTAADRRAIADAIRDVLIEQVASGSARTTARAF